jgi:hypothetical protein
VTAIAVCVGRGDRFAIELGQQDMCDGVVYRLGCVLEQVREPDVEASFAEADGCV